MSESDSYSGTRIPSYSDLLWPTLQVLKRRGGSASIRELEEGVVSFLNLNDEVLEIPHGNGPQSEVNYRGAWARTHLKLIGAVDNASRGVWTITDLGRSVDSETRLRTLDKQQRKRKKPRSGRSTKTEDNATDSRTWQDDLLDVLKSMSADAFERLCQRLLRESGFTKVEVSGRVGDGGIDGAGVLRVNLLSFHVRFQCKRYSGSVATREVRDFRGAMVGRADKGLFITTGRFTGDAEREAVRDGAPAIDLIDGMALCDLLKDLQLGIKTETVEVPRVDAGFFAGV
ncbi:MAG: restriction endonuclease [Gammaproteobacteria bacterium]|nr:restriction endonuclease [Gammaproteobacteria bacterium]